MSLFSPLLMVCADQEEAHTVSELAKALGYPDAHIIVGGLREAIDALNARTSSPEYIIIDIGSKSSEVLPDLDELALHCEPKVRVAVIGTVNDINFYRDLKARGVVEYFNRPVEPGAVRSVLMQSRSTFYAGANAETQGRAIALMSAASGDGASTLAVNLAWCLAEEYKQSTVLVDMDYQFGLVAGSLDLAAPFGIRELFDHPDRGLDDMLVSKMLVTYGERLNIIAAPHELRLLPTIRPEVIRELIGVLRSRFKFVIIDVPHVWTDWTAAALTYCDHTVMVAQLWLRSLTHASRLLAAWENVGIDQNSVSLVINRSGAKFKEAITAQDFERICRHRIEAFINNDVKTVAGAENHGKTIFETGQNATLTQQIKQLAQALIARQGGGAPEETRGFAGKKKLLALFDKKTG